MRNAREMTISPFPSFREIRGCSPRIVQAALRMKNDRSSVIFDRDRDGAQDRARDLSPVSRRDFLRAAIYIVGIVSNGAYSSIALPCWNARY